MRISHAKKLQAELNKEFKKFDFLNNYHVLLIDDKNNNYPYTRAEICILLKNNRDYYGGLLLKRIERVFIKLNISPAYTIGKDFCNHNTKDFILTIF
jgi:hypothetical protein